MALSTFADGRFWGTRYGVGTPWVLALHGWCRDHHDFDGVLEGLDAIAVDLPGFGVAPEPPAPWSTEEYGRELLPVLRELDPAGAVVLGHSFGGRVAVHLAALSAGRGAATEPSAGAGAGAGTGPGPEAGLPPVGAPGTPFGTPLTAPPCDPPVRALVLTGAPIAPAPGQVPSGPPLAYKVVKWLHRAGLADERRMEKWRQKSGSDDYRRATPLMRGVLVKAVGETRAEGYTAALRDWATNGRPLELVWGENDTAASLDGVLALLARPPAIGTRVTLVPGAGHLIGPRTATALREALGRASLLPAPKEGAPPSP